MADVSRFNASPYYQLLGMNAGSESAGTSRVVLPWSEKLTQLYGGVHGGVLLTLADAAVCVALVTLLEDDEALSTVELTLHFLASPGRHELIAEGTANRRGKRLGFGECVIRAGDRDVARGRGIVSISSRDKVHPPERG